MGTYRNPDIIINTDGDASSIRQDSARLSKAISSIGKELSNFAKVNKAREKANWDIYRKNSEASLSVQEDIVSLGLKKGLDEESLRQSAKSIMSDYANAKIRLEQSTGYYDGYENDRALVANTKSLLKNIPDLFSSMSLNVELYQEAYRNKGGFGSKPGQINPRFTDPRFAAGIDIANNRPGANGSIGWEPSYSPESGWQFFQVMKGPSIQEANRKMYEETGDEKYLDAGDEYKLSYTEVKNNLDSPERGEYYNTTYLINPDIKTSIKDIKEEILDDETGQPQEKFFNTKIIQRPTSIEGASGDEIADEKSFKLNEYANLLKSSSDSWVNLMTLGGKEEVAAWIETASNTPIVTKKKVDGKWQYSFNPFITKEDGSIDRDANGLPIRGDEVQLGIEDGYFNTDYNEENSSRNGYSKEDYKNLQEMALQHLLYESNGIQGNSVNRNEPLSKAYKAKLGPPETETPRKLTITERKALNKEEVINQAIGEMPTEFVIKDLTSSSEKDVIASLEQSPKKVIESLSEKYPDFNFIDPENGMTEDFITVQSKYNGRKTKIEVNDGESDNEGHYKDMVEWMVENSEPIGELGLKQQLESVLPNKSVVE